MSIHIDGTLSDNHIKWRFIVDKYVHVPHAPPPVLT